MDNSKTSEILEHLKKHEGYCACFFLSVAEGFDVSSYIDDMRLGSCKDKDIAYDEGITIHTYEKVNQFNFTDKGIESIYYRNAIDETDNDTLRIIYTSGSELEFWFSESSLEEQNDDEK